LEYLLIFLIILVGLGPLFLEIKYNIFELFNIKNSFIIYYILQFGVSGFISIKTKNVSQIALDPILYKDYYIKALIAALLGLVFFQLGYYFTRFKYSYSSLKKYNKWSSINKNSIIALYFLIGLFAFVKFLTSNGGLSAFLDQVEAFRAGGISGQGYLILPFTQLLTIASSISLVFAAGHSNSSRSNFKNSIFLIIIASLPSLILGFRSLLILPFLTYFTIYNFAFKKINFKKFIPISFIVLIVFTFYGIYREIPKGISFDMKQAYSVIEGNPELLYSVVSRSKGIEVVATVIKKMEETQLYDYGYKILIEAATILVPHFLWEGKPETGSVRFTTYFFGSDLAFVRGIDQDSWGGVSPTIIGDAFWNFGWLGVCLIPLALGCAYKLFFKWFVNNKANPKVLLTYALLYPLLSMIPESLQGYSNSIVINIFLITVTLFFLKLKFK
jgi:hypothetical protein